MNFDKVTNPMMKAFFQRLSSQIDKSDIPDGGLIEQKFSETPVEPDETQILKDTIAQLQQELNSANSKIQSLKEEVGAKQSEIDKLQQDVVSADLDYSLLKFEKDQLDTKVAELENQIPEEGTYTIPQLIAASTVFPSDEAEVILRFLQTFIANKEGNTMEQIKAAQKNLEARKSSMPASGEGFKSTIKINEKKFAKIDLIRIINAMYDIGFFASTEGKKKIKGQCMVTIGNALNVDLGDYSNDLSSSMQDGSKIDKHLEIFKLMAEAMEDYFNNR